VVGVPVPLIVGTPVWVYGHVGVLGAVDTDGVEGGVMPLSGVSKLITGAEGFGISAAEGGLRPALPISVAPMGMPTAPTGDPGVDVPAVAAAAAAPPPPIGAQGPDGLAAVPPPATPAPMPPPPELAPMPPPSNAALLEAPVTALVTAAEVAAADNAPPHATPVKGSSGDAPDRIGLAPGVASSVASADWPSRTDAERRRYAQRQSGRDAGRLCLRGAAAQERRRQRHRKTYHHGFGLVLAERSRSPGATRKPM